MHVLILLRFFADVFEFLSVWIARGDLDYSSTCICNYDVEFSNSNYCTIMLSLIGYLLLFY